MNDDLLRHIAETFAPGGIHERASDRNETLRDPGALRSAGSVLPVVRLGTTGDTTADLVLGATLGEGGSAIVSVARQTVLQRDVAVKRVRKRGSISDGALLHEALVMGRVEHPNVVPVHLVGRDNEGSPVIVMKRVEGVTWADVLEDPLNAPATELVDLDYHLHILLQLCNAVRFAHARGVVHLDIKPANVMLGAFGEVYLVDWGIATSDDGLGPNQRTAAGGKSVIRGTPTCMAPEQADGSMGAPDERTDVFLLGATLHQIISGRPIHDAASPMECVLLAFRCEPPEYRAVDDELASIVRRAVSRSPAERFQTAAAFQHAVQQFFDHRESIALARIAERSVSRIVTAIADGRAPNPDDIAESRFALRRSVDIWPENATAAVLRDDLGRAAFEWALEAHDFEEAARSLRDVSGDARASLTPQLDRARAAKRVEREEVELLKRQVDQSTGRGSRIALGVAVSVLWGGLAAYKAWARWGVPLDDVDPNYLPSLLPTIGLPVLMAIGFRRLYASSEFNRRVMTFFAGGLAAVAMLRVAGWALALPAHVTTAMEFIVYGLIAFQFGTLTDLRMSAASVLIFVAAVLALIFPGAQYLFMLAAFAVFAPYVGWLWVNSGARSQPR